jgi:hypothetical protein
MGTNIKLWVYIKTFFRVVNQIPDLVRWGKWELEHGLTDTYRDWYKRGFEDWQVLELFVFQGIPGLWGAWFYLYSGGEHNGNL